MATEQRIIRLAQREFNRRNQSWRGDVPESVFRHPRDINHERDAASRPDVSWRSAARDARDTVLHGIRQLHGFYRYTGT